MFNMWYLFETFSQFFRNPAVFLDTQIENGTAFIVS